MDKVKEHTRRQSTSQAATSQDRSGNPVGSPSSRRTSAAQEPGSASRKQEETVPVNEDIRMLVEETCETVDSLVSHYRKKLSYWERKQKWLAGHIQGRNQIRKSDLTQVKKIEGEVSAENGVANLQSLLGVPKDDHIHVL